MPSIWDLEENSATSSKLPILQTAQRKQDIWERLEEGSFSFVFFFFFFVGGDVSEGYVFPTLQHQTPLEIGGWSVGL